MGYLDEKFEACVQYTIEMIRVLSIAKKKGSVSVGTIDSEFNNITVFHLDREEVYGTSGYEISPFKKVGKYNLFNYGERFTTFRFYKDFFCKTKTGKMFIGRITEELLKAHNIKVKCSWDGCQTFVKIKYRCL